MAYKRVVSYNASNTADAAVKIKDTLVAMGWELYDDQSVSGFYVFKSAGEAANQLPAYLQMTWNSTVNYIDFRGWHWWNNTTQTGQGYAYNANYCRLYADDTGAFFLWLYGDMDFVGVVSKLGSSYYSVRFGFMLDYWDPIIDLTASAAAGSGVTISVADSSGFEVGAYYQIVNKANADGQGGRERVEITAIPNGTSLTLASLAGTYNIGSRIGDVPQPFVVGNVNGVVPLQWYNTIGTATQGSPLYLRSVEEETASDPSMFGGQRYAMVQSLYYYSNVGSHGFQPTMILKISSTGRVDEDIEEVARIDSGSATSQSLGGTNTLTDSAKAWTVNEHVGKVVVIPQGTGVGQIRVILSNTATVLTLDENWETNIDVGDLFDICEKAYRYFPISGMVVKEA